MHASSGLISMLQIIPSFLGSVHAAKLNLNGLGRGIPNPSKNNVVLTIPLIQGSPIVCEIFIVEGHRRSDNRSNRCRKIAKILEASLKFFSWIAQIVSFVNRSRSGGKGDLDLRYKCPRYKCPRCKCGVVAAIRVVRPSKETKGKLFCNCRMVACKFFRWLDPLNNTYGEWNEHVNNMNDSEVNSPSIDIQVLNEVKVHNK
ncbi:uncharacterized protein LOC127242040 [Andrographis paniculata]|uniref:uncharacterized protein LOC127242040 n=1 Tax=Andrographis paniculata TaxID=175694 RepID=UPI0021E86D2A|nr:uncharacterized protein LOC127242040 [Andrographis paniculata]